MSSAWTETLTSPIARAAGGGDWHQIQRAPGGGWYMLAERSAASWYHSSAEAARPVPLSPLDDERLPGLREATGLWLSRGCKVELMAWRVGRRAVFRVTTDERTQVCKLYRKDSRILDRWQVLRRSNSSDWRSPQVVEWDPRLLCLTIEHVPGTSLNQRWIDGAGEVEDADRVADLLAWLQSQQPPADFPAYCAADEASLLERRLEDFRHTLATPSREAPQLTGRVISALLSTAPGTSLLCHRDLHDKQILLDDSGGNVIDLDLAAVGPAALDLGNILAHARLRALKGAPLPWRRIATRLAERVIPARGLHASISAWTAAALMRLTLIYARRRRAEDLLERLLASTQQALECRGEWDFLK